MIHFSCPGCGQSVRVADSCAGKKGRCPGCKQVVNIPAAQVAAPTQEPDALGNLAAALGETAHLSIPVDEASAPEVPRPPSQAEAEEEAAEPELLPATDPNNKTDKLEAVVEEGEAAVEPPESVEAPALAPSMKKFKLPLIIGGAALAAVLIGGVVAWLLWPGGKPSSQPAAGTPATATAQATQPAVTVAQKRSFPLASGVEAAVSRAPAGVFCILYVDFAAAAKSTPTTMPTSSKIASEFGASKLWNAAAKKIDAGILPATGALFLTTQSEPADKLLGRFYGALPGGTNDPQGGLWPLLPAKAQAPHFLLRLTGKACAPLTEALLTRAGALDPKGSFPPGKVVTFENLRLSPSGVGGMRDEMLLGTVGTITAAGVSNVDKQQQQRLRDLLGRIDTARPIVGCVLIRNWRGVAAAVAPSAGKAPAWEGGSTVLLLSIDPRPAGAGTLVLTDVSPEDLKAVGELAVPMSAGAEAEKVIRIDGAGEDALDVLAKLLPGFREIAVKAVTVGGQASEAALAAPKPAAVVQVDMICVNPQCPTRGAPFKLPSDQVPPGVRNGTEAMQCPHCKQRTAIAAVRCTKCRKWFAISLNACPYCGEPRKQP